MLREWWREEIAHFICYIPLNWMKVLSLSLRSMSSNQWLRKRVYCVPKREENEKKRPIHWMNWNKNANLINDFNCLSSSFQVMYLAVSLSSASARRSLIVHSFAKRQIKMFWNVCETIAICFQLHEIHFFSEFVHFDSSAAHSFWSCFRLQIFSNKQKKTQHNEVFRVHRCFSASSSAFIF